MIVEMLHEPFSQLPLLGLIGSAQSLPIMRRRRSVVAISSCTLRCRARVHTVAGWFPFDVNTALVPAGLRAVADLSQAGIIDPDLAANASQQASVWQARALPYFRVEIPAQQVGTTGHYTEEPLGTLHSYCLGLLLVNA